MMFCQYGAGGEGNYFTKYIFEYRLIFNFPKDRFIMNLLMFCFRLKFDLQHKK